MTLSWAEEYALVFVSELLRSGKRISVADVAKKHGISYLFLKKIAGMLKNNDIVNSREGSGGGYALNNTNYTIWDIVVSVSEKKSQRNSKLPQIQCPINKDCLHERTRRIVESSVENALKDIPIFYITNK